MGVISEGVDILKLVNKAQNADLYKQLGEWIDKVIELQKENEELRVERNQLREQVRFKAVLERINGHTFVQGGDEEICPSCAAGIAPCLSPAFSIKSSARHKGNVSGVQA